MLVDAGLFAVPGWPHGPRVQLDMPGLQRHRWLHVVRVTSFVLCVYVYVCMCVCMRLCWWLVLLLVCMFWCGGVLVCVEPVFDSRVSIRCHCVGLGVPLSNNRGSCDQSVRGSPVCNCQLGFAGIGCAECAFGFTGEQCDQCLPDFVGPRCQLCPGSNGNGTVCDNRGSCEMGANGPTCSCDFPYATDENGSCNACFGNRIGATCDRCHDWQYGYDCSPCPGSYPDSGTVCNGNGQCDGVGTTGTCYGCVVLRVAVFKRCLGEQ